MKTVTFEGVDCTIAIRRPADRVSVIVITGKDRGEHGDAPMRELSADLERGPIALFVDARGTIGANLDVSDRWARWLGANRARFTRISMLTGSRFVQLTAEFVRRFSELGELMHIYTDPVAFETALSLSCA
ncbi:MAG TPA: hypothetical protein VL463_02455 [Kofleriaceae bacterium]|jgi:hypothetical protein|nr:hypothetical protein [Kofleriaceae bacterium]